MAKFIGGIVLVLALIAGSFLFLDYRRDHGPCGRATLDAAIPAIESLRSKLDDAERLAGVTPRMTLAGPVAGLQEIARQTKAVVVPQCLERAKFLLAGEADMQVTRFEAFMAEQDDVTAAANATAETYGRRLRQALGYARSCTGGCPQLATWTEQSELASIRAENEAETASTPEP